MQSWQYLLGAIVSLYVCFGVPYQAWKFFHRGGGIKSVNAWWFVLLYILAVIGLRQIFEWLGFGWLLRPENFINSSSQSLDALEQLGALLA